VLNKKKIITASFWVVGIFGLSQLLRLGSNLVVTRLLEPEIFGLMAIVYVVMHGVNMFSDVGLWAFIVRHQDDPKDTILDTVWTMQVVRGWFMFAVVLLMALVFNLMSSFNVELGDVYGNDKLPVLLIIVGFNALINGYKTMAPAMESRQLKRGRLELIELTAQICGAVVMLVWAWKQPSIWALVSAGVVATMVNVALTYKIFSYRHKLAWNKEVVKEVFNFGKWIFIASALTYLANQGDKLIFASYITAAELGVFSIAVMLVGVFSSIIEQLTSKIGLPVLSQVVKNNPEKIKEKYYFIRLRQDFIAYFFIGILIASAPLIIEFLYDERYHHAGWMMQILSISLVGLVLSTLGLSCLTALGSTKIRVKIMLMKSLMIFIGLPVLWHFYGFVGAVWAVTCSAFVAIPIQYIEMNKYAVFSFIKEVRVLPVILISYYFSNIFINEILA